MQGSESYTWKALVWYFITVGVECQLSSRKFFLDRAVELITAPRSPSEAVSEEQFLVTIPRRPPRRG